MKPESTHTRTAGMGRKRIPLSGGHLPMEWMDAMCWRLPSGKALAEFALQAGFLAPLILSGPVKRTGDAATAAGSGKPAARPSGLRGTQ